MKTLQKHVISRKYIVLSGSLQHLSAHSEHMLMWNMVVFDMQMSTEEPPRNIQMCRTSDVPPEFGPEQRRARPLRL